MDTPLPDISLWPTLIESGGDVLPWMVDHVAKEALSDSSRGPEWIRAVILAGRPCDVAKAVLAKYLRERHDDTTVAVVARILTDSRNRWARLAAAEALRGPWAAPATTSLVSALADTGMLLDMWAVLRISDAAAIALDTLGQRSHPAFQEWYASTEADLNSNNRDDNHLAIFVLAQLGMPRAVALLRELSRDPNRWQAHEVLEALQADGTPK